MSETLRARAVAVAAMPSLAAYEALVKDLLAALASTDSDGMDAAWAEAEAAWEALGPAEGSSVLLVAKYPGRRPEIAYEANGFTFSVGAVQSGPTPAAALRALADALAAQRQYHPEGEPSRE